MGRVVVITGGTSGIGRACAEYFESRGDTVVVLARKKTAGINNFYMCDVAIPEMTKTVFAEINKKFGKIDVLINNAGYGISGATELISHEEAQDVFEVNFFGVLNCTNSALPYMGKGSMVINMSSMLGLLAAPYRALYNASKAALNSLTFSVAMELKPAGINVVAVCPADVKTNFSSNRVKVYDTNERYGERVKNAVTYINENEADRMDPIMVAAAAYKYSLKKNPKPFIIVGTKYKILYFLSKLFTAKFIYRIIAKMFDGRKEIKTSDK